MATIDQEALDVLACEFALRPVGAPGPHEIRRYLRAVERRPGEIIIEFEPPGIDAVSAFVAAERACCANLTWALETQSALRLTIGGTMVQIDVLAQMFAEA
jgi:hypothetical protein